MDSYHVAGKSVRWGRVTDSSLRLWSVSRTAAEETTPVPPDSKRQVRKRPRQITAPQKKTMIERQGGTVGLAGSAAPVLSLPEGWNPIRDRIEQKAARRVSRNTIHIHNRGTLLTIRCTAAS
jgi:hypothetical protein